MTETELKRSGSDLLPDAIPVLIVDDDQSVLDVTKLVLSRYRFEQRTVSVIEAKSAAAAKDILSARSDIAVLFLDVVMGRPKTHRK